MTVQRPLLLISLALCAAIVLPACATVDTFEDFDSDQNGLITGQEAEQTRNLADVFQTADFNKDGGLDKEEFDLAAEAIKRGRTSEKRRPMGTEKGGLKKRK